jgi:16S rRNA (guanine966-N2)-methyltransferase
MRVIAGEARGRPLQGPRGTATRPTSDLIRGAIFSMLEARGAVFDRVLDLYAGTGALGIEALSRGAEHADFVEQDRSACQTIAANLVRTGLSGRGHVICAALPGALARLAGPYQLLFVDPPYELAGVAALLSGLGSGGLIDEDTAIVYEHSRRTIPPEACGGMPLAVTRRHGSTAISLYRLLTGEDEPDVGPDDDYDEGAPV